MSTVTELEPGTTFAGQFRIVRRLATGGMGAVYVAEQIATGRQRALKLMHPNLVSSRELRDKFTLEARRECVEKKGCPGGHAQADGLGDLREPVPRESRGHEKEDREKASAFCNEPKKNRGDHPMNCISFDDASTYCRYMGKKLPTEEQWEYAARGTDGRGYPWGHEPPTPNRVNGCTEHCATRRASETIARRLEADDAWESTSPTGAFPEGVSPFGAFDMAGNVAEWVDAPFCNYGQSACGTASRVVRGGSWMSDLPSSLRTTARGKLSPATREADIGFRCVK